MDISAKLIREIERNVDKNESKKLVSLYEFQEENEKQYHQK